MSPSIILTGSLFLGFALAAQNDPSLGDSIVMASIAEPSNLIPMLASDSASADISRLIFNGLVKYDKNLRLVGDLAESWEVAEGGLRIVFHLRKNVRWQDGAPFTSRDVEFTYRKLMDPATPTPYGGDFEKVKLVRALDDHAVEVVYKEPFSPGLASWSMGIIPEHLLEGKDLAKTDFGRRPVGTGPYVLKKWKNGETIELWANPDYFEGRPHIDRCFYRVIPDTSTIFLELEAGAVDMAGLTPLQFKKQTGSDFFRRSYNKFEYPSFSYTYIGYNLKNPLFSDKRARRALGLAIDKKELIDVVLLGLGKASTGPFLPDTWAYNGNVRPAAYDPQRARELLKEVGWADTDGDGYLDKEGKRFSFTILTNQGNEERRMVCEIIQKKLKNIGVEVKIQVLEWGTFLSEFVDKRRFEAVFLAWQLSYDPDVFDIFHSSRIPSPGFNFVSYENAEVDALLEEARRLFDEKERTRAYHRIHEILSEEEPYTFLYVPETLPIVSKRFVGPKPEPAGLRYNFIEWFVPVALQKYRLRS